MLRVSEVCSPLFSPFCKSGAGVNQSCEMNVDAKAHGYVPNLMVSSIIEWRRERCSNVEIALMKLHVQVDSLA